MKLRDILKWDEYPNIKAAAAGTQATVADSRSADEWIKNFLDQKNKRLNDFRVKMNTLLGPEKGEVRAAYRMDKPTPLDQDPGKAASGGSWAVVDPEGTIISTWKTHKEAEEAAFPMYGGLLPSATGPTGGARVRKINAADIFQDTEHGDRTRSRFLKGGKPSIVKLADWLRIGDRRPSSADGSAGPGGGDGGGTS